MASRAVVNRIKALGIRLTRTGGWRSSRPSGSVGHMGMEPGFAESPGSSLFHNLMDVLQTGRVEVVAPGSVAFNGDGPPFGDADVETE